MIKDDARRALVKHTEIKKNIRIEKWFRVKSLEKSSCNNMVKFKKNYLRNQREACCHKMFVKRERLSNSVLFHDNKAHRICVTEVLILILS